MVPFTVLVLLFVLLGGLGRFGFVSFGWWTSLRFALAGMFLLTSSAHWGRRRQDLVRMVPPFFAHPGLIVSVSGVLEILGAAGLMVPSTARYAAAGLCLMLLAMFPANVYAARRHLSIGGKRVMQLVPRTILQIVFVAATAVVFLFRE